MGKQLISHLQASFPMNQSVIDFILYKIVPRTFHNLNEQSGNTTIITPLLL